MTFDTFALILVLLFAIALCAVLLAYIDLRRHMLDTHASTERLLWELYADRPDRGRIIPGELTQRVEIQLGKRDMLVSQPPQR